MSSPLKLSQISDAELSAEERGGSEVVEQKFWTSYFASWSFTCMKGLMLPLKVVHKQASNLKTYLSLNHTHSLPTLGKYAFKIEFGQLESKYNFRLGTKMNCIRPCEVNSCLSHYLPPLHSMWAQNHNITVASLLLSLVIKTLIKIMGELNVVMNEGNDGDCDKFWQKGIGEECEGCFVSPGLT